MARRELRLELNHRFSDTELGYWLGLFDSPACKVTKKEDGGYYLTACRFENLEHNEVHESAKKLKIMMIAFAKIELDIDFQSIEHDEEGDFSIIREQGEGGTSSLYVSPKPTNGGYVIANPPKLDIQGGSKVLPERQECWYDYFLNRCDDWIDATVLFKALSYFAEKKRRER